MEVLVLTFNDYVSDIYVNSNIEVQEELCEHKFFECNGKRKVVYCKRDDDVFYTKDEYEKHLENIETMLKKSFQSTTNDFFKEQFMMHEKSYKYVHQLDDIIVIEKQIEVINYCYSDPITGKSIKIAKNSFYAKNADERFPNRHMYVHYTFQQEIYENYYQLIDEMKKCFKSGKGDFLNTYEVINNFKIVKYKKYNHVASPESPRAIKELVKSNYIHSVFDSHTMVSSEIRAIRQKQSLDNVVQDADDYDVIIGYTSTGKAKHYKNNSIKMRKIENVEKILLNHPWYKPFAIVRTNNGCQPRYAYDNKYYIAHDESDKAMKCCHNNSWMTLEGYQNFQYLRSEYFSWYMSIKGENYLDKRCTNTVTKILREGLSQHYKNDNSNIPFVVYSYVTDEQNRKYSPEFVCDKIKEEAKSLGNEYLMNLAIETKSCLRKHVIAKEKLDQKEKKKQKNIPQKIIDEHKFLSLIQNNTISSYEELIDMIRKDYPDFLMKKEISLYDIGKIMCKIDLRKYLNTDALGYVKWICFKESNSRKAKIEEDKNGNNVLYEPIENKRFNVVNLACRINHLKKHEFLNKIAEAAKLDVKYYGKNKQLKNAILRLDKNIENLNIVLKKVKGKNKIVGEYAKKIIRMCEVLKIVIQSNYTYEYNKHLTDEYVTIAQKLVQLYIDENVHGNSFLRSHNGKGATILFKALSSIGILQQFMLNKIDIYQKNYDNPLISVIRIKVVSSEEIMKCLKIIADCDKEYKTSIIFSHMTNNKISERYGKDIAKKCVLKKIGLEAIKKTKYVKKYGRQFQNVDMYHLSQYGHIWCKMMRMSVFSYFKKYVLYNHKLDQHKTIIREWVESCIDKHCWDTLLEQDKILNNINAYIDNLFLTVKKYYHNENVQLKKDYYDENSYKIMALSKNCAKCLNYDFDFDERADDIRQKIPLNNIYDDLLDKRIFCQVA